MAVQANLFGQQIHVINVGLEHFAAALEGLGVPVVRVAWSPPAGGDGRKAALLAALDDEDDA